MEGVRLKLPNSELNCKFQVEHTDSRSRFYFFLPRFNLKPYILCIKAGYHGFNLH